MLRAGGLRRPREAFASAGHAAGSPNAISCRQRQVQIWAHHYTVIAKYYMYMYLYTYIYICMRTHTHIHTCVCGHSYPMGSEPPRAAHLRPPTPTARHFLPSAAGVGSDPCPGGARKGCEREERCLVRKRTPPPRGGGVLGPPFLLPRGIPLGRGTRTR